MSATCICDYLPGIGRLDKSARMEAGNLNNRNGTDSEEGQSEPSILTPRLAVALDLFGQVVAHRAACVAAPRWLEVPKHSRFMTEPMKFRTQRHHRTQKNHAGLELNAWRLAKDWRRYTAGNQEFPLRAELSDWVVKLLAEYTTPTGFGVTGHPGDLRAIQAAYLAVSQVLLGGSGNAPTRPDMQSLVIWLYAVPHFADLETSVATWCAYRFGALNDSAFGLRVEAVQRDHDRWARAARQRV